MMPFSYATQARMSNILHDCRFNGGISASGQSAGFGGNLFTRDTLRVLRDVMGIPGYQSFIREMMGILPQWQGTREDPATNEFPDALSHQVFRSVVGGRYLPSRQVNDMRSYAHEWNIPMTSIAGGGEQLVIYNSSDGPLLYLITLGEYIQTYNDASILQDRFHHHATGITRTIGEAAGKCISYIRQAIAESPNGLYSVPNTNPRQTSPSGVMRDGSDAYVRSDGSSIDYERAAYIENQALAHHALDLAAHVVFPDHAKAPVWLTVAHNLRDATIEQFWIPQHSFFAAAIDRYGQVDMLSSAVFELLDSPFFLELKEGNEHVENLVRALYNQDTFMTPIGARMVSLEQTYLEGVEYYAYQGSGAVWPVTNGIIANGLRRWGLNRLAHDLGHRRLVGGVERSRQACELIHVHRETNRPLYVSDQIPSSSTEQLVVYPSDRGQLNQAWTASAALRQLHYAQERPRMAYSRDLQKLDDDIGAMIVRDKILTPLESDGRKSPKIVCDFEEGAKQKKKRARQLQNTAVQPRRV